MLSHLLQRKNAVWLEYDSGSVQNPLNSMSQSCM